MTEDELVELLREMSTDTRELARELLARHLIADAAVGITIDKLTSDLAKERGRVAGLEALHAQVMADMKQQLDLMTNAMNLKVLALENERDEAKRWHPVTDSGPRYLEMALRDTRDALHEVKQQRDTAVNERYALRTQLSTANALAEKLFDAERALEDLSKRRAQLLVDWDVQKRQTKSLVEERDILGGLLKDERQIAQSRLVTIANLQGNVRERQAVIDEAINEIGRENHRNWGGITGAIKHLRGVITERDHEMSEVAATINTLRNVLFPTGSGHSFAALVDVVKKRLSSGDSRALQTQVEQLQGDRDADAAAFRAEIAVLQERVKEQRAGLNAQQRLIEGLVEERNQLRESLRESHKLLKITEDHLETLREQRERQVEARDDWREHSEQLQVQLTVIGRTVLPNATRLSNEQIVKGVETLLERYTRLTVRASEEVETARREYDKVSAERDRMKWAQEALASVRMACAHPVNGAVSVDRLQILIKEPEREL